MATRAGEECLVPIIPPVPGDVPIVSTSEEKLLPKPPAMNTLSITTKPEESKTSAAPTGSSSSPFYASIAELKGLSSAILSFQDCYEDLRSHLESIKAAIAAQLPSPGSEQGLQDDVVTTSPVRQHIKQCNSELEGLCRTMSSRAVRKYLVNHLSDLPMLRTKVPVALKLAPNPPKLVLECFGKFFLQGSAAFAKSSSMTQIHAREASIFILECFLLMMRMENGVESGSFVLNIDEDIKSEANLSAMAWRKRLIAEGGLRKASQIDAGGLLLLVACFGIPVLFKKEDIRDLVIAANSKEIMDVIRNSSTFMNRISEIVDEMLNHKMEIDAVEIIYAFSLEGKYDPRKILLSFLRQAKESGKKQKKMNSGCASSVIEYKKTQLSNLTAITNCLERYNVDVAKLLAGWQIKEKIAVLERDLADIGKKSDKKPLPRHKRKRNEVETSSRRQSDQQAKRSRYGIHHPPCSNRRESFDSTGHSHQSRANSYSASPSLVYSGPGAGGRLPPSSSHSPVSRHLPARPYPVVHAGLLVDPAEYISHPHIARTSVMTEMHPSSGHHPLSVGLPSLFRTSMGGYPGEALIGSRGFALEMHGFAGPERFPGALVSPSIASIASCKRPSYLS